MTIDGSLSDAHAEGRDDSKYAKYTRVNHFFATYQEELIMSHPHVRALKRGLQVVMPLRAHVSVTDMLVL